MPTTEELLQEIEDVFPLIAKPQGIALSFHQDGCLHCRFIREYLEKYSGSTLPDEAMRYICNEMGCFSTRGFRWVFPSYIRYCLAQDTARDPLETEFLIYHLGPHEKNADETREQLAGLAPEQLRSLLHFLEWCREHPHWSGYCATDVARAITFVTSLLLSER